jgi:hypothetical protein
MSTLSGLIMRLDRVPRPDELNAALAAKGIDLRLDSSTRLHPPVTAMIGSTFGGERAHFEYAVDPLQPLIDAGEAPANAGDFGDSVLWFETRGEASMIAAMHVQALLSERWGAAGWVEDELIAPMRHAADCADSIRTAPEMRARLAEIESSDEYRQQLEAAHRAWLEKERPKTLRDWMKQLLRDRGADIVGWVLAAAVLAGLLLWSQRR